VIDKENQKISATGVEWGSDRRKNTIDARASSYSRLAGDAAEGVIGGKNAHSIRSIGSAALNYALVAQGGLDLFWYVSKYFAIAPHFDNGMLGKLDAGRGMFVRVQLSHRRREVSLLDPSMHSLLLLMGTTSGMLQRTF
jgi:hypothetical protein